MGESHSGQEGMGLGLFHAKNEIEGWGGEFEINSVFGEGAAVCLKILCAEENL